MKKIIVFLLVAAIAIAAIPFTASAAGKDNALPKLVYEPATITVKTGGSAVLSATAQGEKLHFSWIMNTSEDGKDHYFDLSSADGVKAFEALDGGGKMKVTFKTENLEDNQVRNTLTIDNIIEFNYGARAVCVVTNETEIKTCDPAVIYTSVNAPAQLEMKIIAEFDVRRDKLVKLSALPTIPEGAPYDWDDIEYNWYQTPDGDKANGYSLDEHDPVLMAEAYGTTPGVHYFYCQIYVKYGITDFYYETGVTEMNVYEPKNIISFDKNTMTLNEDQEGTINLTVQVDPEKDKGDLSYIWVFGKDPNDISIKIPGEFTPSLTLMGSDMAETLYYSCIVTNTTDDNCKYDNEADEKPYVKVVFTGKKGPKITQQPKDASVRDGEDAYFSVKADNAKSYSWFMVPAGGGTPVELDGASKDLFEGTTSETLTVHATLNQNDCSFFCVVTSDEGATTESDSAKLTVEAEEITEITAVSDDSETSGATSGATSSEASSETSGEGQRKGPGGLVIALLALIGALTLALVGVGIAVLIKTSKKK